MHLLLIGFHAIGITVALLLVLFSDRKIEIILKSEIDKLGEIEDPAIRVECISKVASSVAGFIPWYQKGISVVGVFAFLSMAIATGVQTSQELERARRIEKSKTELMDLKGEIARGEHIIELAAQAILDGEIAENRLSSVQTRILKHVLGKGLNDLKPEETTLRVAFAASLLFQDKESAMSLYERNTSRISKRDPASTALVAEYSYLTGALAAAADYAERLLRSPKDSNAKIELSVQVRMLGLLTACGRDVSKLVKEVADRTSTKSETVQIRQAQYAIKLKRAAKLKQ